MSTLLVQSCSKSKNRASSPGSAFDLYSGYYYRILKKAIAEGEMIDDLDICILSAKHGLLTPDEEIEVYDRRMDAELAAELRPTVTGDLCRRLEEREYDEVVVNAGKSYRAAIEYDALPVPVREVPGGGIGEKGQNLKRFIRGERAALTEDS